MNDQKIVCKCKRWFICKGGDPHAVIDTKLHAPHMETELHMEIEQQENASAVWNY